MLERASLEDFVIISVLEEKYGLKVATFEFLPVGAAGWCYLAETEPEGRWFVKLRKDHIYPPGSVSSSSFAAKPGCRISSGGFADPAGRFVGRSGRVQSDSLLLSGGA